jgi:hypothetical protein
MLAWHRIKELQHCFFEQICITSYLMVKGNAILEAVGVPADNERLEWVEGLLLKTPSEGVSKSDMVELMLGLRLKVEPDFIFLAL